jgi:polysaccharide transporter, PST family
VALEDDHRENKKAVVLPFLEMLKTIRHRRGVRESLSNIGWLSSDRILRMLGGVVVALAVARYLGPDRFGLLNYGIAIYGLFNVLSNLGLDSLIVRDLALDPTGETEILGTSAWLKAAASVVTSISATLTAYLLDSQNKTLIYIVAVLSFCAITQAFDVIDYLFQSQTRSRYSVMARGAAFFFASVARLTAVFMRSGVLVFAWVSGIELVLGELGLMVSYLLSRHFRPRWKWNVARGKALMTESWPLMLAGLMITIYTRCDQVLLGRLTSNEVVGNYSAAIRLSEIWYSIPMIVCSTVMPRLVKTLEGDPKRYYARLQRLYEGLLFISAAVAMCTQFAGPLVVRLLYGPKYSSTASILSVHIWTGVFVFIGVVGGFQRVHERIAITIMSRTVLGSIVNVALNVWWIPRWGGFGSAMATLVAQSVAAYFGDALDPRSRHIFRMKTKAFLHFWTVPKLLFARVGATLTEPR